MKTKTRTRSRRRRVCRNLDRTKRRSLCKRQLFTKSTRSIGMSQSISYPSISLGSGFTHERSTTGWNTWILLLGSKWNRVMNMKFTISSTKKTFPRPISAIITKRKNCRWLSITTKYTEDWRKRQIYDRGILQKCTHYVGSLLKRRKTNDHQSIISIPIHTFVI